MKWRTILGLILVYAAVLMNWQWLWGILFLLWVIPDLRSGFTYFLEPISKKENPILFWFIMASWLLMSAYMIATAFVPQLQTNSYGSYGQSIYAAESIGVYTESPVITKTTTKGTSAIVKPSKTPAITPKTTKQADDPLQYKALAAKTSHFIGIPIQTTYKNDAYLTALEEAWTYFGQEDISAVIPNIIEERVYAIYTNYNQPKQDDVTILLGYKTNDIQNVYEGLMGMMVPTADFAILENKGQSTEQFLTDTWAKVLQSDLKRSELADMEVYQLHPQTGKVEKVELRIALDTGKKSGAIITKMGKKQSHNNVKQPSSPTIQKANKEVHRNPTQAVIKQPKKIEKVEVKKPQEQEKQAVRQTSSNTAPIAPATPISPKPQATDPTPSNTTTTSSTPKTTAYKTEKTDAQHFIGISAVTTFEENHLTPTLEELWNYFFQNDLSQVIPNIVDEKVYVVYSDYDQPKKGAVKVTLAYRTSDTKNIYKGLTGVSIPASTFAVFESKTNPEQFIKASWEKALMTNIHSTHTSDLEVYTIHPKTYKVEQVALKVAIQ